MLFIIALRAFLSPCKRRQPLVNEDENKSKIFPLIIADNKEIFYFYSSLTCPSGIERLTASYSLNQQHQGSISPSARDAVGWHALKAWGVTGIVYCQSFHSFRGQRPAGRE